MDPNGAECMFELYHTVPHPLTTGNTRRQRVLQAYSTDLWENFSWANRTQFGANLAWIILEALLQVETNLIFTNFYLSRNPTITLNQSQRLKSRQPHVLTFLKHTRAPLFTPSVYLTTAFKYLPPKEKYLSLRSFPFFFSLNTIFYLVSSHISHKRRTWRTRTPFDFSCKKWSRFFHLLPKKGLFFFCSGTSWKFPCTFICFTIFSLPT